MLSNYQTAAVPQPTDLNLENVSCESYGGWKILYCKILWHHQLGKMWNLKISFEVFSSLTSETFVKWFELLKPPVSVLWHMRRTPVIIIKLHDRLSACCYNTVGNFNCFSIYILNFSLPLKFDNGRHHALVTNNKIIFPKLTISQKLFKIVRNEEEY